MNELRSQLSSLLSHRSSYTPKIKPHEPDTFHGHRSKLRSFVISLRIYITFNESRFVSERSKVIFACSFLRDSAFAWIEPLIRDSTDISINTSHEVLDDFEGFVRSLTATFGDVDEVAHAERRLRSLRQTTSVTNYATEFQQITSHLSWNEDALCFHFKQGLKSNIKDELARDPSPSSVEELVEKCVRIDNRFFERSLERSGNFQRAFHQTSNQFQSAPRSQDRSSRAHFVPRSRDNLGPRPMDLDFASSPRKPLTSFERSQRLKQGLCLYCEQPGHIVRDCPSTPQKRQSGPVKPQSASASSFPASSVSFSLAASSGSRLRSNNPFRSYQQKKGQATSNHRVL